MGACVWVWMHVYVWVWVHVYVWVWLHVCGYPGELVVKRDVFCCDNLYYGLLLISNCYPVWLLFIIRFTFDVVLMFF